MDSKRSEFRPAASSISFFLKGAGAGLIVFLLVGGAWQVTHFWWVVTCTSLTCGCISTVLHSEFQKTLTALIDSLPWI